MHLYVTVHTLYYCCLKRQILKVDIIPTSKLHDDLVEMKCV